MILTMMWFWIMRTLSSSLTTLPLILLKSYNSAWQQFCNFCVGLNVQPITSSVAVIVKYICHRFEDGVSYSTMNITKSAISKFHCHLPGNIPVGQDQLVQKAMKSFFKQRPPLPKYRNTFDVTHSHVIRHGYGSCCRI